MTTTSAAADAGPAAARRPSASRLATFRAMLLRDLTVLDRNLKGFIADTVIQPIMLVFFFTYVFPKIGQGIGGDPAVFSTLLIGGLVAEAILFLGMFQVAIPVAEELDETHEIEDRVLAPTSLSTVAVEKIAAGALQGLFAAMVVFPVAAFIPATPIYLDIEWPVLLTVTPLACIAAAGLGLTLGTRIEPRSVPQLTSFIALPIAFFGAIFFTWGALDPIPWLKYPTLLNPLVYMSEGFRAALSVGVPHMSLWGIYAGLLAFAALFATLGIRGFKKRVLS